jgi:branched-chain amino acid transport system ATP-binding protein
MLSLARALVGRPRLLLLDEPSLGLAPALRQRLAELLAGLIGSGIGLLLVEQDPDFAKSLCRRSILLVQGRVSESSERGQPREMVAASHNNEMRNI